MAELVNQRLANLGDGFGAVARDAVDRPAEDRDLVGQQRRVVRTFGERDAAIDSQQLVVVPAVAFGALQIFVGRLFLDGDDDVLDEVVEALRKRLQRLLDDPFELVRAERFQFASGGRSLLMPRRSIARSANPCRLPRLLQGSAR